MFLGFVACTSRIYTAYLPDYKVSIHLIKLRGGGIIVHKVKCLLYMYFLKIEDCERGLTFSFSGKCVRERERM
jgi:hypothetical protein